MATSRNWRKCKFSLPPIPATKAVDGLSGDARQSGFAEHAEAAGDEKFRRVGFNQGTIARAPAAQNRDAYPHGADFTRSGDGRKISEGGRTEIRSGPAPIVRHGLISSLVRQ
jgi:hypothetical protein